MVVVGGGEATGRAVYGGEPVDRPRHAHPDREHHDIPVSPCRPSKNPPVREVVVRDRKSWPVEILDVCVEQRAESRVIAPTPTAMTRASSRMKAPSAGICLLDRVELPVSGSSKCCLDGSLEDDEQR